MRESMLGNTSGVDAEHGRMRRMKVKVLVKL